MESTTPEIEEICGNCKYFHLERGNSGRCAKFDDLTDVLNLCEEHEMIDNAVDMEKRANQLIALSKEMEQKRDRLRDLENTQSRIREVLQRLRPKQD